MAAMFDGLDDIPWKSLRHAHGESTDLPDLLRALAAKDRKARTESLTALFGNIWHQGAVFEATAPVVPFLIELLSAPDCEETEGIIELLLCIAAGQSYHQVQAPFIGDKLEPSELRGRISRETAWVEAARCAVEAGWTSYARLLSASKPCVRERAAHLMAACRAQASTTAEVVRAHLAYEATPAVQASLVLALAVIGGPQDVELLLTRRFAGGEGGPLLELVASIAVARLQPDHLPERVLERLVAAADYHESVEPLWESFAWRDSPLLPSPSDLLPMLGPADRQKALPRLLQRLPKINKYSVQSVARVLLALCFDEGQPLPPASRLSSEQRQVLRTIANDERLWKRSISAEMLCRQFGLPVDRKDWLALVK